MGNEIDKIRAAVLDGRYVVSDHAWEELEADRLHVVDVEAALLTGSIVREQLAEPGLPGPRYTVQGKATDLSTDVVVVCRFAVDSNLLIITVYVPSDV